MVPAVFQSFYCNYTLYKMDTSIRWHLVLVHAVFQSFYCNYTLYKMDTSIRWHLVLVPAVFQSFYCNYTLYKMKTSIRWHLVLVPAVFQSFIVTILSTRRTPLLGRHLVLVPVVSPAFYCTLSKTDNGHFWNRERFCVVKENHFIILVLESKVHYKRTFTALWSKSLTVYNIQAEERLQNIKKFAIYCHAEHLNFRFEVYFTT